MSHKRAHQLTVSGEWARHLRPYGKRAFWKAERGAYREHTAQEASTGLTEYDLDAMPTKVQELIARLEADGCYQVSQKGIHRPYHHGSRTGTVTVAGKPSVEVPPSGSEEVRLHMQYLLVIEQGPGSVDAYVPDLPGFIAAGDTREEVATLIHEAIALHIEALMALGQQVPSPHSSGELVSVDA